MIIYRGTVTSASDRYCTHQRAVIHIIYYIDWRLRIIRFKRSARLQKKKLLTILFLSDFFFFFLCYRSAAQVKFRIIAAGSSRVGAAVLPVPDDVARTRQMQSPCTAYSDGHDRIFWLVLVGHIFNQTGLFIILVIGRKNDVIVQVIRDSRKYNIFHQIIVMVKKYKLPKTKSCYQKYNQTRENGNQVRFG